MDRTFLDRASVTRGAQGRIDPPVSQEACFVPDHVELAGGELRWRVNNPDSPRSVTPPDDVLTRFVNLGKATDQEILQFALRSGVLLTCEHNRPFAHSSQCTSKMFRSGQSSGDMLWVYALPRFPASGAELADAWRLLATQAKALVFVTAALRLSKRPDAMDMESLYPESEPVDEVENVLLSALTNARRKAKGERVLDYSGLLATCFINRWLRWANVHPVLSPASVHDGDFSPRVVLTGAGLFGAVATRLMCTVSASTGFALCSGCGSFYRRMGRQPARNRRNYCEDCRSAGVPIRDANRDRSSGRRTYRRET